MADIINRSRSSFQLSQTQGLEFFLRQFCMQPLPCLWYWAKRRDLFPVPILGHQVLHLHPFVSHVSSGLREGSQDMWIFLSVVFLTKVFVSFLYTHPHNICTHFVFYFLTGKIYFNILTNT